MMHSLPLFTTLLSAAAVFQLISAKIMNQCTARGVFAMTWDDGPAQYTKQVLDTLAAKGIKATFHLTTKYLSDPNVQSMIQQIAAGGHLIGLRAESDWNLQSMSDDQIRAGFARQGNVLAQFIGYVPKFARLPYDGSNDRVVAAVESTGLVVTTHNLETYDYYNDGTRTLNAVKLALSLVGKGAGAFISVQHDGVQQSAGVTDKIIDYVKSAGYKFVTLDACLGLPDATKNKEKLKGEDDSLDLGPMAGGISPASGGSGMSDPGAVGGASGNSPVAGQANSGATNKADLSSLAAAMIAVVAALLVKL